MKTFLAAAFLLQLELPVPHAFANVVVGDDAVRHFGRIGRIVGSGDLLAPPFAERLGDRCEVTMAIDNH